MDVRNELTKTDTMRNIRSKVKSVLSEDIKNHLKQMNMISKYDSDKTLIFLHKMFIRWVFNSNIQGHVHNFIIKKLCINEKDLAYHVVTLLGDDAPPIDQIKVKYREHIIDKIVNNSAIYVYNAINTKKQKYPIKSFFIQQNNADRVVELIMKNVYVDKRCNNNNNNSNNSNSNNNNESELIADGYKLQTYKKQNSNAIKTSESLSVVQQIPQSQFTLVKSKYNRCALNVLCRSDNDFVNKLGVLCSRYSSLGVKNLHTAMPPKLVKWLGIDVELFGTPLNTVTERFCSPFADIEKYFGSVGSMFDYNFTSGETYTANPPYDEYTMIVCSKKVIDVLNKIPDVTFIYTMPVWDSVSQEKIKVNNRKMDFEALDILLDSDYVKGHKVMHIDDHKYYNYFTDKYVGISNTHLVIVSNHDNYIEIDAIVKKWKDITIEDSADKI